MTHWARPRQNIFHLWLTLAVLKKSKYKTPTIETPSHKDEYVIIVLI